MRRTGLPALDLRILDPVLSYLSTILGRERAIVINLEQIITAQLEVLFLNSRDPLVAPFIKKLQGIFSHRQAVKPPQEAGAGGNKVEWANLYSLGEPQSMVVSRRQNYTGNFLNNNKEGNADGEQLVAENAHGLKLLPFEFVALEACLEATCRSLDNERTVHTHKVEIVNL